LSPVVPHLHAGEQLTVSFCSWALNAHGQLQHAVSGHCLVAQGRQLKVERCDASSQTQLWKFTK
jgi:hypothetical protein